jgi:hypothetical protein
MSLITGDRPTADEYASFFADYIDRVPDGAILTILHTQLDATQALLAPLSRAQALARPTAADCAGHELHHMPIFMPVMASECSTAILQIACYS